MKKLLLICSIFLLPVFASAQTLNISNNTGTANLNLYAAKIYPNPSNGLFKVEFANPKDMEDAGIVVYNNSGMVVLVKDKITSNPLQVDLNSFKTGIYYLVLSSRSQRAKVTEKIIITK